MTIKGVFLTLVLCPCTAACHYLTAVLETTHTYSGLVALLAA